MSRARPVFARLLGGAARTLCAVALAAAALSAWSPAGLGAQPRSPVIQNRVTLDPAQPVGFDVIVWPDTVYVGQQATYEMGVFISESAQRRMRRNPEVVPAELRGVLAYDLGGPQSLPAIVQNGIRSFPHILQRALFPLADGLVTIPASQLSYSLPRTSSYFSREEAAGVRAGALSLHVKSLPTEGKPAAFSGAVGVLSLGARVDVVRVRVGDPVVLTLRVGGRGNVKLWPRPELQAQSASLVEAGVRVRVDSTGQYIRGTKEFDWLVTPEREGRITIPVVEYPYFDPYAEEYRVASSDSIAIDVEGGTPTPRVIGEGDPGALSLRRDDRGPLPVPLTERPLLWAMLALLPIPAWAVRRKRAQHRQAASDASPHLPRPVAHTGWDAEGRLAPVPGGGASGDPLRVAAAAMRRRLLAELATDLDAPPASLVERSALERKLRRRGVTRATTAKVMALLAELEAAAWSPPSARTARDLSDRASTSGDASWADRCASLAAAVREEAMAAPATSTRTSSLFAGRSNDRADDRRRGSRGSRSTGGPLVLLVLLGATAWLAAVPLLARSAEFTNAVVAYEAGDYTAAAGAFSAIAAQAPRHADAWANAGTAGWAAGDTVIAVAAWQRALRLEPDAADMRNRLLLIGADPESGIAPVSSLPRSAIAWLAVALWLLGWHLIAWHRGTAVTRLAIGALAAATIAGAWQYRRIANLDDPALAVVAARESLRPQPSTASVAGSPANTGTLVRRQEERTAGGSGEVWVSVQLDAEHEGWLPASGLHPLFGP